MFKYLFISSVILISYSFVSGQKISNAIEENFKSALADARAQSNYNALADVYYEYGLYEEKVNKASGKSFEYLRRSLQYYEVITDTIGINKVRFEVAKHFLRNEMYYDALEEFTTINDYYKGKGNYESSVEVELYLFELYLENIDIKSA